MAQHYLLNHESRTLSLKNILLLTEEQAFQILKIKRWGNPDDIRDVCCPHCGVLHRAYFLQSRQRWCCKHCQRHFYITTKTVFSGTKLPFVDLLGAIALFVNEVKGISAITMSRHFNINYKTAFVLCQTT